MSNVQDTSLEAYYSILSDINDKQMRVIEVFLDYPDRSWTNMELASQLGWSVNRITPRTYELRDIGVLKWVGVRKCRVTGNTAKLMEMVG